MQTAITLHDLLRIILYLAGAGALIYLALVLKNVLKLVNHCNDILEENHKIIDDTIKKVPTLTDNAVDITNNVNIITKESSEIVTAARPDVEKIVSAAGNVAQTVDDISRTVDTTTLKVKSTVSNVSDTISDTAKTISINANNIIDYFYIAREVVYAIKDVFLSK
ncbi:hypothetical protein [Peptoniphilus stercorisuis]|uniref:ABC-type transporter Mla subunit MlaD n=1 Tax=Peptoniphilus stercorisuis TaxID=1436965 RepID=A0ABS4KEI7_9FIRM|nr:hypothetical protein [Peptoniphilus stercorisuis]MBP2026178.1 ABC-type transporter Mla subunit MlaD [Peptoniphilus stercorisuis]